MGAKSMQDERVHGMMKDLIHYTRKRALEYKTFTGAYIVKGTAIIWRDITSIEKDRNPLAHAELKAIQGALSILGESLAGCEIFTTQQPCPMCASATVWSGIEAVYYGVPASHQWQSAEEMQDFLTNLGVSCTGPILENECKAIDDFLIAHGV
jgi:tRNA(Arg) A34 adenosine deaminase TadA